MTSKIYIDKGAPLAAIHPETLSDGSQAWNLYIRGELDYIPCISEIAAEKCLAMIADALTVATGERPLVL